RSAGRHFDRTGKYSAARPQCPRPAASSGLCSPAVADSIPSRHTTLAGAVGLFGLFAGLCAIFALVVTVFQWRAERAQTKWPLVSASIEHAEVAEHATSKGATTWSLRYRVRYDADWQEHVATVSSPSTSAAGEAAAMRAWLAQH